MLTIYAVCLLAIPSRLIFGPLGGAGTPAVMVGLGAALWWTWDWLARPIDGLMQPRPIRRAVLLLVLAAAVSYIGASTRPLSGVELNSSETGLLILVAWLGVVTVATDGISSRERLYVLTDRLALAGGLLGLLGIVQFATGLALTNYIQIPGLTVNSSLDSILDRGGFNRPAGTAIHPIEFGTALTVLLPICLHFAFTRSDRSPLRRWWPVATLGLAIPLSISRSAILGAAVVLAILLPTWTRPARLTAAAVMAIGGTFLFVLVPGFLGTFTKLFTGVSNDSSALSRSDSYGLAGDFIERSPWIGRGYLTFLPEYRILDNQYLGMLIDAGVVGLVALLGVFATAIICGWRIRTRSADLTVRSLATSLIAGVASAAAGFAFFDAFSFPLFSGLTLLVIGLLGCLHRLERHPPFGLGAIGDSDEYGSSRLVNTQK